MRPKLCQLSALDAITYSDEGEVKLSGRGAGEGFVRVYLDNAPVTLAPIEADGSWQSDLAEIDTGIYTLRVDELDAEGNVVSRVESPFKREDQAFITETTSEGDKIRAVTVQPGNTLWAISNAAYGDGYAYIRVFEAKPGSNSRSRSDLSRTGVYGSRITGAGHCRSWRLSLSGLEMPRGRNAPQ